MFHFHAWAKIDNEFRKLVISDNYKVSTVECAAKVTNLGGLSENLCLSFWDLPHGQAQCLALNCQPESREVIRLRLQPAPARIPAAGSFLPTPSFLFPFVENNLKEESGG